MKKQLFLKNAALLTATALILRGAGMAFRVYIANRLGDEGMGLYQLIFTLYNLGITLATTGVSVASTRMVASFLATRKVSCARLAARVLRYSVVVGTLAGAALFFSANPASALLLQDERAALSLRILAPSLPFMAAGAALRGCFAACRQVKSSSGSQLFEQVVRIGLVALLLPKALVYGTTFACAAVVVGNTVSEILSACWMYVSWQRYLRREKMPQAPQPEHALREYASTSAPVTATRGVGSVLVTLENMLVPTCLALYMGGRPQALAAFGRLKGMAMPVIFFPFSFLATISTLLLPEITEAHTRKDKDLLYRLVRTAMRTTTIVALLMSGLFTTFSGELGLALYHSAEIGLYLRVLGPLAPCMYLESMVDGILRGLGEQMATFRYSVTDSVLRIAGVVVLAPRFGMWGFLFVMIFSNLFTCTLNLWRLLKVTGIRPAWGQLAVKPLAALAAAWAGWQFAFGPLAAGVGLTGVWYLLVGMAVLSIVYLALLWVTGCIGAEQLAQLGLGRHKKTGEAPILQPGKAMLFF